MQTSDKSSEISSPKQKDLKPINIFFIWYAELCRRSNISPLPFVRPSKPKTDTVLDFNTDRIKAEDWIPIINALRLDTSLHVIAIRCRLTGVKFLYDINTEEKVKQLKSRCAVLWTDYILRSLIRSLNSCMRNSQVLSTLELDALPLSGEYFDLLLQTLKHNRTIKFLSLAHCPITDVGCGQLCAELRYIPNIEVLNLSSCSLGVPSAESLAKTIKHQQLNRYCESWQNSLRYKDPTAKKMGGLKRLSLNNNPNIGDEGIGLILNELYDDLWIEALDIQKCNITEQMSNCLINLLQVNETLVIADVRNNEKLSRTTLEKLFDIIKNKHRLETESKHQWYGTTTTLFDFERCESSSSNMSRVSTHLQKSKSATLRKTDFKISGSKGNLRKTKTVTMLDKKNRNIFSINPYTVSKKELDYAKRQYINLNAKFQSEVAKRREIQKKTVELQQKLKDYEKLEDLRPYTSKGKQATGNTSINEVCTASASKSKNNKNLKKRLSNTKNNTNLKKTTPIKPKKGTKSKLPTQTVSSPKTQKTSTLKAQSLFEGYLNKNRNEDDMEEEVEMVDLLDLYDKGAHKSGFTTKTQIEASNIISNSHSLVSGSEASLDHLLSELSLENRKSAKETVRSLCEPISNCRDKNLFISSC